MLETRSQRVFACLYVKVKLFLDMVRISACKLFEIFAFLNKDNCMMNLCNYLNNFRATLGKIIRFKRA